MSEQAQSRGWASNLFRPIDGASLAFFRIVFGALLLFESVNYGLFLCLDCMYRDTELLFKYEHFEWVALLPGKGLEWMFLLMALCASGVMCGFFYRTCLLVYTVCFTYLFLLDQALYLNHFYMVILLCIIMFFVPAHNCWSIDARRGVTAAGGAVPAWARIWLLAQLEIVLVYAGLVKINTDWLNLEPMRLWMTEQSAGSGALLEWLTQDPGIFLASYGAIALHIVGAPLLLWRKTRLVVFVLYAIFHTINAFVFDIGIFPWMTLAATTLFFPPNWPRTVLGNLSRIDVPVFPAGKVAIPEPPGIQRFLLVAFIFAWLALQVTLPWRHLFLPGNVAWNEAGHHFSWRMKLRDKRGYAKFYVLFENGGKTVVDPAAHLNRRQVFKMVCIPDLLWQYAQFLEHKYESNGMGDVSVYVDTACSLNGREPAPLVNRLVDLTTIDRNEPVQNWVLPLGKRLPGKRII